MSIRQTALNLATLALKKGARIFGKEKSTLICAHLSEQLAPISIQETAFGDISFFCPGILPVWRARTLLTKEPETIEWIHTFDKDDVLWDVGANVGVYSLYAALKGHFVLAFEPSPSNYYLLSKNMEFNKLDSKISGYCIAFSDVTKLDAFHMANTELGGALNSFGEALDWQGKPYAAALKQAMVGFSVDYFIEQFKPLFPNHLKVDVDGIENKIIKGAKNTLSDKRLKSVLIELDTDRERYCEEVTTMLASAGLKLLKKVHAAEFDKSKFSSVYNHIFMRVE